MTPAPSGPRRRPMPLPALARLIEEEERELEWELEDYTVVPVVSLSLTYSF